MSLRKVCEECDASYHATVTDQRFCSDRCRAQWHRAQQVPAAVLGTRRAMREMADGSIRVQIEIDPPHRRRFLEMFGEIDQPVALALVTRQAASNDDGATIGASGAESGAERVRARTAAALGPLATLAVRWCKDPQFWAWATDAWRLPVTDEPSARQAVLAICHVESRRDLDVAPAGANLFHEHIRRPYSAHLMGLTP